MTLRWLGAILVATCAVSGGMAAAEPVVQPLPKTPRPASIDRLMALAELDPVEFTDLWDAARKGGLTQAQTEELLQAVVGDSDEFKRMWRQAKAANIPSARLIPDLYLLWTRDEPQPAAIR